MSQRDIRSLFGQKSGRGDDEISETMRMSKQMEKRKAQQKHYDQKRRKRDPGNMAGRIFLGRER